jgi:hypothetical protein
MKKDDILFVCTLITVSTAIIGTTCAVLMAYHIHKAVGEIGRVADGVAKRQESRRGQNSSW